jgi:hypothetical protein
LNMREPHTTWMSSPLTSCTVYRKHCRNNSDFFWYLLGSAEFFFGGKWDEIEGRRWWWRGQCLSPIPPLRSIWWRRSTFSGVITCSGAQIGGVKSLQMLQGAGGLAECFLVFFDLIHIVYTSVTRIFSSV